MKFRQKAKKHNEKTFWIDGLPTDLDNLEQNNWEDIKI